MTPFSKYKLKSEHTEIKKRESAPSYNHTCGGSEVRTTDFGGKGSCV